MGLGKAAEDVREREATDSDEFAAAAARTCAMIKLTTF